VVGSVLETEPTGCCALNDLLNFLHLLTDIHNDNNK
jgi:hypothetical protein